MPNIQDEINYDRFIRDGLDVGFTDDQVDFLEKWIIGDKSKLLTQAYERGIEEERDRMRQILSEMSASTIRFGGDKMSDSYMSRISTIAEIEDALNGIAKQTDPNPTPAKSPEQAFMDSKLNDLIENRKLVNVPIVGTLNTATGEIEQKTDKPQ